MAVILIATFFIFFAFLSWKKIDSALFVLAALLPAYLIRFNVIIPLTLLEGMILILFASWFIQNRNWEFKQWRLRIKNEKPLDNKPYPFRWPLIAWLFASLIAVGVAGWGIPSFGIWRAYFFEPVLLYIVVVNVCSSREKIIRLLWAFAFSAFCVSIFAGIQYITGHFIPNDFWAASSSRRATSFFPYPNAVGLYLAPIILLLAGVFGYIVAQAKVLANYRWQLAGLGIVIILSLGAIVAARSEGALFGTAAAVLIFGIFAPKKIRVVSVAAIIIGAVVIFSFTPLRTYVHDRLSLENFSGQVRRVQWHETWKMLKDGRLISGAGLNNYQASVKPFHQEGLFVKNNDPDFQRKVMFNAEYRKKVWQPLEIYLYPHNIILNFWSEVGLFGLITFFWIIATFFYYGITSYRSVKKNRDPFQYIILGLMCALLVSLIHGIVDVPYFKNDLSAFFWIEMGLMSVIVYKQNHD